MTTQEQGYKQAQDAISRGEKVDVSKMTPQARDGALEAIKKSQIEDNKKS